MILIMFEDDYQYLPSLKEIKDGLSKIGHNAEYIEESHGGGQAIKIDRKSGNLIGGSDPRKDGYAEGY